MSNWFTRVFKAAVGNSGLVSPGQQITTAKPPSGRIDTSIITLDRPLFGMIGAAFPRYNPDDLVAKKGLQIYGKMRLDEQVKAVCTFKRDAILSRGWTFTWPTDSPLSVDERDTRSRILEQIIERMPGSFVDSLNAISMGREFGFSLTEKVYQPIEIDDKQWVGLRALRGRDPSTFEFITDEYGELLMVRQVMAGRIIEFQLDKFIHYVHNPEFDIYFGQSELREAYRSWYMKDTLIKYWAYYMEKLGGGLTIASIGPEANIRPGTQEYTALQNALAQMKNSAGMILPPGVTAQVNFPTNSDSFQRAIEYHDLAIAKALLVPNLLGVSTNQGKGSLAQSQSQLESFAWTLKADADRLESCISEQLINDLGDQNWGDGEYPYFTFKPLSTDAMQKLIATWAQLISAGAVIPTEEDEARLREILEMPDRDPDMKTLQEVKQELMPPPPPAAPGVVNNVNQNQMTPKEKPEPKAPADEKPTTVAASRAHADSATLTNVQQKPARGRPQLRVVAHTPDGNPRIATKEAFTRALLRVEFSVIEHKTQAIAYDDAQQVARLAAKAVKAVIAPDALPKLLDQDVTDIGQLRINGTDTGKIKGAFKQALQQSWVLGQQQARKEMATAGRPVKFAAIRDNAAEWIEANGFRMAQNLTEGMRAIIQQELLRAVKVGERPEDVTAEIYNRLISQGFTTLDAVKYEEPPETIGLVEDLLGDALGTANVPAYLNTLVRTNTFEALNEARYAEFTDPALSDFIVALEYSAVLDDRTTEICRALDGSVYKADNPVWDEYRPPNHYNCRSLLVPVTTLDGWDGEESPDPTVEPQVGFARGA